MKEKKLLSLIDKSGLIIPNYLFNYKELLNINYEELIFISLLLSYDNDIRFDINKFKNRLHMDDMKIMKIISSLIDKKLLAMNVVKYEDSKTKEFLDISIIKNKIISLAIEEETKEENNDTSNIYTIIEKEFARTLSPIECETIKGWLDNKIEESMIKDALKEAVLNGVTNLKYIDKILYEWKRNGKKRRTNKIEDTMVVEIPDDNWWDYDE